MCFCALSRRFDGSLLLLVDCTYWLGVRVFFYPDPVKDGGWEVLNGDRFLSFPC